MSIRFVLKVGLPPTIRALMLASAFVVTVCAGGCMSRVTELPNCEAVDGGFAAEGVATLLNVSSEAAAKQVVSEVKCVFFTTDYEVLCSASAEVSATFLAKTHEDAERPFVCSCDVDDPPKDWFCQAYIE